MIAITIESYRHRSELDDSNEFETFERFTYRRSGEFPVRSQTARTRGRLRSRGGAGARHKAGAYNCANRRELGRPWR
jgi:hypothetical protein